MNSGRDSIVEIVSRRAIWGRDEGHCRIGAVCNFDFIPFELMWLDHIKEVSKGGDHTYANVRAACEACNRSRNNHWADTPKGPWYKGYSVDPPLSHTREGWSGRRP